MPKSQYKSNYELKGLARMQTSHHIGILIATVLLNLVISYAVIDLFSSIIPLTGTVGTVLNYLVTLVAQVLVSVLDVGVAFIFMKSACNMQSSIKDLFFGYQHHFGRAVKIGILLAIINAICMIPAEFATVEYSDLLSSNTFFSYLGSSSLESLTQSDNPDEIYAMLDSYTAFSNSTFKYCAILMACSLISFLLTLPFFPAYYMLLDFPNQSVSEILKKCFEVMHGNKLRLFLMYISFLPLMLLGAFTCGIALIWVVPYMKMTATNFYLDLMSVRNKNLQHINKTV